MFIAVVIIRFHVIHKPSSFPMSDVSISSPNPKNPPKGKSLLNLLT
jgi:hypothetical protein